MSSESTHSQPINTEDAPIGLVVRIAIGLFALALLFVFIVFTVNLWSYYTNAKTVMDYAGQIDRAISLLVDGAALFGFFVTAYVAVDPKVLNWEF